MSLSSAERAGLRREFMKMAGQRRRGRGAASACCCWTRSRGPRCVLEIRPCGRRKRTPVASSPRRLGADLRGQQPRQDGLAAAM